MGRTYKDTKQNKVLEVVKREDGTFDFFLNRIPHRRQVPEAALPEELCVRFGFCGEEYDAIMRKLNRTGKRNCS